MYTTKKGQQGEDVLFINEIQSICPFTPALVVGGNLGQTQIIRLPCSTVCPFATIRKGVWEYVIGCNGNKEVLILKSIEPTKDNNNDNIKKMIIT
jgi:hypothetical protein